MIVFVCDIFGPELKTKPKLNKGDSDKIKVDENAKRRESTLKQVLKKQSNRNDGFCLFESNKIVLYVWCVCVCVVFFFFFFFCCLKDAWLRHSG